MKHSITHCIENSGTVVSARADFCDNDRLNTSVDVYTTDGRTITGIPITVDAMMAIKSFPVSVKITIEFQEQ